MPDPELVPINLDTVNEGALREAFDIELKKVLANISDVNTPATATREITMKLKFKPQSDRTEMGTTFTIACKLASIEPHCGRLFMGRDKDGNLYGFQDDPRQQVLFEPPEVRSAQVVNFGPVSK